MKKLLFLFIMFSSMCYAQDFHERREYRYGEYSSKELIKLKTENYLMGAKNDGFKIIKNEITDQKFDITMVFLKSNIEILKYDVIYYFYDESYNVNLFHPQVYNPKTKKWMYVDDSNAPDLMTTLRLATFTNYQNGMLSNF